MKKFLFSAIVILSACQLKAQQLQWFKPLDTLSNNFDKFSKLKPKNQFPLFAPGINLNNISRNPLFTSNVSHVDNMPIVTLDGFDKMQVAKLAGYDRMAIKLLGVTDPGTWMQTVQNLPTVKNPLQRPYVTQLY
jgi:hypothetical protein